MNDNDNLQRRRKGLPSSLREVLYGVGNIHFPPFCAHATARCSAASVDVMQSEYSIRDQVNKYASNLLASCMLLGYSIHVCC